MFSGKIYTAGTNFTRPPVSTVVTNLNSALYWLFYTLFLPLRSDTHWLVGEKEKAALLKAPVGLDPLQPPGTGWQFSKEVKDEGGTVSDANS